MASKHCCEMTVVSCICTLWGENIVEPRARGFGMHHACIEQMSHLAGIWPGFEARPATSIFCVSAYGDQSI